MKKSEEMFQAEKSSFQLGKISASGLLNNVQQSCRNEKIESGFRKFEIDLPGRVAVEPSLLQDSVLEKSACPEDRSEN